MFSDELNDLLSLLVTTILADKRVFAREIETFMKGAKRLQNMKDRNEKISEAKLLAWFENNSGKIRDILQSSKFEPWIHKIFQRLQNVEDKNLIVDIMTDISRADDDFHISEKALIVLTKKHLRMSA